MTSVLNLPERFVLTNPHDYAAKFHSLCQMFDGLYTPQLPKLRLLLAERAVQFVSPITGIVVTELRYVERT